MNRHLLVVGIVLLFIVVGFQPAFANNNNISVGNAEQQPSGVTFMKTFGGKDCDRGYFVQQTTDGGYIMVGETGDNVWLIKTDSDGNIVWDKTLEGYQTDHHSGNCVRQTIDGGYIITGNRYFSISGVGGVWLIKTDNTGNKIWDKTFGGFETDVGYCVQQTTDGGYIITGEISGDVCLIKTNSVGNKEWDKYFGGTEYNVGYCVQQTIDSGYIITGETDYEVWLIKTDSDGNKLWDRIFEGTSTDVGYSVQQTTDSGYIITGQISADVCLIKTDSTGNKEWDKTFEGILGHCVQQTTDGGYIITGAKMSLDAGIYVLLIKTDSAGNKEWDNYFAVTRTNRGFCVQQTTDGGYIIVGDTKKSKLLSTGFDVLLIKTDENGNVRNKSINTPILNFLQSHPNMFPLLQKLLFFIK